MDQMNQAPNTTPMPPMPKKKEGGVSGMIAIVVIIVLLVVGGIYYLMMEDGMPFVEETLPTLEDAQNSDDPAVQAALTQNESDELSSIEADVGATDFAEIDAAFSELDAQ